MSIAEVQARVTALSTRLDTLGLRPGAAVDPAAGEAFRASLGQAVAGQGAAGGLGGSSSVLSGSSGLSSGLSGLSGATASVQGLGPRPGWATTAGAGSAASAASAAAAASAASSPASGPFGASFAAATARYDLPPGLLQAVAQRESSMRADAVSSAGARGLMQLMPATAASLGVDPMVPDQAIDGAARYLRQQLDTFGRLDLALAAYNAGPGNVRKHGGIPPFAETRSYVTAVTAALAGTGGTRP